jgi:CO/xanthine dehydrogenase Mo-binding subunit
MGASAARVELGSHGRARVYTGTADQGSGAHRVLASIVARELHLSPDEVDVVVAGTDEAPFDSGSSASRVSFVAGTAAQRAAAEVRRALVDLAAELLGCPPDAVAAGEGGFSNADCPDERLSVRQVAAHLPPGRPLVGEARFEAWQLMDTPSFAALVAEVEVDPDTGAVAIRRLTGAYDVGAVLDESGLSGQLNGGLVQGLGFATMEEVRRTNGRVETVSLADYKLPTIADVPPHEVAIIADGCGAGPFGGKSVGELTNGLAPPAIANAVHDALGVWITDLPVSAERIYRALNSIPSPRPIAPERA